MPNHTATNADRLDLATGFMLRTCSICSTEAPLTAENFYLRPGSDRMERRCQTCRRARNAEVRAARRSGNGVRGGRKFGVEIEYIGDRDSLEREMIARGLRVHSTRYTHQVMSSWKIVSDASVYGGFELVSPPLSGAAGLAQLKLACDALEASGARVNRSCGLHVHHDVNDLRPATFGRLFRTWASNQTNIDALVAPSRRNSQWAQPLQEREVVAIESLTSLERTTVQRAFAYTNRYRSLNVAAFPRYGTVEVRQHQGTLSFDKIAAWIGFGQAIIALAKSTAPTAAAASAGDFLDSLAGHGLSAAHVTFLKGRVAHFQGRRVPAAA